VTEDDLDEAYIIPSVFDRDVSPAVAKAVIEEARNAGIARVSEETGSFATIE
jgi:malic enzyme